MGCGTCRNPGRSQGGIQPTTTVLHPTTSRHISGSRARPRGVFSAADRPPCRHGPGGAGHRFARNRISGLGRTQHPQMTSAADLHRVRASTALALPLGGTPWGTGRLAHRVGQSFEVVPGGLRGGRTVRQPDDFPAARSGQPLTVFGAQVVAVGLGIRGERAEDRGRVGIDVRQCRDSRAAARGARTATYRAHDVGRYRTLERAATNLPSLTPPCRSPDPSQPPL